MAIKCKFVRLQKWFSNFQGMTSSAGSSGRIRGSSSSIGSRSRPMSHQSTGCDLPHYSKLMSREWRYFNRTLNELLDEYVIDFMKRFTAENNLKFSNKVVGKFTGTIN